MIHLHHIVPRHAGGTDDPSNLFPLNHIQHALAHRNRAILLNSSLDWITWKMMSGQMGKEEVRREAWKTGYRNRDVSYLKDPKYIQSQREKSLARKAKPPNWTGRTHSLDVREDMSNRLKGNKRALGAVHIWTDAMRKAQSLRLMGNKNRKKAS